MALRYSLYSVLRRFLTDKNSSLLEIYSSLNFFLSFARIVGLGTYYRHNAIVVKYERRVCVSVRAHVIKCVLAPCVGTVWMVWTVSVLVRDGHHWGQGEGGDGELE